VARDPLTGPPGPEAWLEGEALDASFDALLRLALAEDVGPGDVTTQWTVAPDARGSAVIVAKQNVVIAGLGPCIRTFHAVDSELEVTPSTTDGAALAKGATLLRVAGRLGSILTAERVVLNFLGHLSGIATLTRRFVDAVQGTGARILDTRKTGPGWRVLEKSAVRAGGGFNHRMGLHDYVLVKDNHIAAAGGITAAVAGVRAHNERKLPIEVEVKSLEELEEALALGGLDRILLDNMTAETMRAAVRRTHEIGTERPELEASGNVTLDNVRAVAETGVDWISVGALTHSAPAADLSLRVE
jgi:nicotinate-nucleotide pyrophosphorylase (carboxylating)